MPVAGIDTRDQRLPQDRQLIGRFGNPVFDAVHALTIRELATIEPGTTTGAVRQSFRAGFGTDIQRVLQAATAASITANQ